MPRQIDRNFVKEETLQSLLTSLTRPCVSPSRTVNRVVNVTPKKTLREYSVLRSEYPMSD